MSPELTVTYSDRSGPSMPKGFKAFGKTQAAGAGMVKTRWASS
jgi:hypothetical protein